MHERQIHPEELQHIVEFLTPLELLKTLDRESIHDFAKSLTLLSIGGGDTLIQQGERDATLYILYHGRLRVYIDQKDVAEVSRGQVVGEIALLTGHPRTATVKAIRDSVLLKWPHSAFEAFEKRHPQAVISMAQMALKRVISKPRMTQPGENIITIAVAPASSSNHFLFMRKLVDHLNKIKPTLFVNKERVNKHFQKEVADCSLSDPEHIHINDWLNSLEEEWGYIVYEMDRELTSWSMRCLRQSDRLFLVAEEGVSPHLNSIEKKLFGPHSIPYPTTDIVFIHPEKKATGTAKWLENRPLENYHHLRLDSEEDFGRLIRFLTGKAFGVVLNGGGIRGFSHSGVVKAIDELQVPIDFIGGTSAGALVAAMYAGFDGKTATEICMIKDLGKASKDYTFPFMALLRGKNASKLYRKIAEDRRIEDLWTRFFCVSTNVTESKLELHKDGLLWVALRASTALPGIYPPIFNEKGEMLVDGGVLDNMPVGVMRKLLGGGKILAVNCYSFKETLPKIIFKRAWLSGWRLFFRKMNPFRKKIQKYPNILEILRISLRLAAEEHQKKMEQEADYLLEIDTSKFALLDFSNRAAIIEMGYKAAMENLPQFLKLKL